jgi:hypothetical protein
MPRAATASSKRRTVSVASGTSAALSSAAFSRSSRPMPPISCEQVMATPGNAARRISAVSVSCSPVRGEKSAVTATAARPRAHISRAATSTAARSSGRKGRPS